MNQRQQQQYRHGGGGGGSSSSSKQHGERIDLKLEQETEREFTDFLTKHISESGFKIQMGGLRQSLNDINTNSLAGVRG